MKTGRLFLFGEISTEAIEGLYKNLVALDVNKAIKRIELYINTGGGTIYDAFALYDYIRAIDKEVVTHAAGQVMSAGTIVYLAGDQRITYPTTTFMVHQMSDHLSGNVSTLKADVKQDEAIHLNMIKIYKSRTSIKRAADWEKMLKTDTYINAEEAIKIGLATHLKEGLVWS